MRALLFLVLILACLPARAELWGYVDGDRVAHLANERLNHRYHQVSGEPDADAGRVAGKLDGRQALLTWLEISPEAQALQPTLRAAAARTGVDAELLKAVIAVESGYKSGVVSPRGAIGLMQITPVAANRYATPAEARQPAAQRLLNAQTNIDTGARMLADLLHRFKHVDTALAAWNEGETAVRSGGAWPDETQAHVQLVLELYWALLQQSLPQHAQTLRIDVASP